MYWFRNESSLALLPWMAAMLVVWLGGWLLATHAFKLDKRERLIAGLGLGIASYAWLVNLLGRWLSADATFYGAAVLVLLAGVAFAWRRADGVWLDRQDLRIWPWLIAGLGLIWIFLVWSRGLAIFDEYKNLSLISIIGTGDIPPHFIPWDEVYFSYHYGFHLFAASLMRLGGMLPWSAFDAGKSILWGITLLLAGLLGRRVVGRTWGSWAAAGLVAFASGTRFLLLLLPPSLLLRADSLVQLQGTSAAINLPFSQALLAGWPIDGGPPFQYMFAFLNGILQPFVMAHQGPNTFSLLILFLLWLLLPRLANRWSALVIAVLFGAWALAWETTYALFLVGLLGFTVLYYWRSRNLNLPDFKPVLAAAAFSVLIALLQGGTLTEMARGFFSTSTAGISAAANLGSLVAGSFVSSAYAAPAADLLGFSLRWPPAILSSHLGALSIFSPVQLIIGLFEVGPVLLFTPWITRWAWRRSTAGEWQYGVLAIAAWVGFLIPLFLQYEADRDISRLSAQALFTWTIMLLFLVADGAFAWKLWLHQAAVGALVAVCFGGVMVAGTQFSAASVTDIGDAFNKLDASISAQIWGTLPETAKVYGPLGRTTILSGHLTGQLLDRATPGSQWDQLFNQPSIPVMVSAGFDYFFIDSRWFDGLPEEIQAAAGLEDACVKTVAEVWDNSHVNYRRLLDLQDCH